MPSGRSTNAVHVFVCSYSETEQHEEAVRDYEKVCKMEKTRGMFANVNDNQYTTTVLRPFFRDHPGEPVPEENFWTLWCKGRQTEADTLTIRLHATPSRLTSAHLHHPHFLQARCPSCHPTNSVKALKATSTFGLGRRR